MVLKQQRQSSATVAVGCSQHPQLLQQIKYTYHVIEEAGSSICDGLSVLLRCPDSSNALPDSHTSCASIHLLWCCNH